MLGLSGFEIPVGILARAGKLGEIIAAMGVRDVLGIEDGDSLRLEIQ